MVPHVFQEATGPGRVARSDSAGARLCASDAGLGGGLLKLGIPREGLSKSGGSIESHNTGKRTMRALAATVRHLRVVVPLLLLVSMASTALAAQSTCDIALAHFKHRFPSCQTVTEAKWQGKHAQLLFLRADRMNSDRDFTNFQYAIAIPEAGSTRIFSVDLKLDLSWTPRILIANQDGFLVEGQPEKWDQNRHIWILWPSASADTLSLHHWRSYRFTHSAVKDDVAYYLGTNEDRQVVVRYNGDGTFSALSSGQADTLIEALFPQQALSAARQWNESPSDGVIASEVSIDGAVCMVQPGDLLGEHPSKLLRTKAGRTREYRIPPGTMDQFRQLRPEELADRQRYGGTIDENLLNASLGPVQVEGPRIWYGRQFYGGEGYVGIGGFGYLDCATGEHKQYFPAQSAPFMTRSLLVEPDAVWLSLANFGEYGNGSGGLLRWQRADGATQRFGQAPIASAMVRDQGDLILLHDTGMTAVHQATLRTTVIRELDTGETVALSPAHSP